MSRYHLSNEYPHEHFIQTALKQYFTAQGYSIVKIPNIDLVCIHEQNKNQWVIEAKGKTKAIGLDFRTGIGQLIHRMSAQHVNYALAVPDIPEFIAQAKQLASWVKIALNIHFIFINEQGSLRFVSPNEQVE
jgi:hypothetical protein